MTTPEQLPLNVVPPRRRAFGRGAFLISDANAPALAFIDAWRDWPGGQGALTGPEGAGKTHLAHVWMEMSGAEKIAAARLSAADVPDLVAIGAVAVEDVDRMAVNGETAGGEAALFHLMNLMRAEGGALLLTGREAPGRWPIGLRDLASRAAALSHVALKAPDEALMRGLLTKQFADRRLKVGDDVIQFLGLRLGRSAAAAVDSAARLDRAALTAARRITVPFVKEVLNL